MTVTLDGTTNIFTDHVMQIFCYTPSDPDSDSDGDEDGFASLPGYAQGLIIATCIIFGIAILFVASKVIMFNNTPEGGGAGGGDKEDIIMGGSSFNDPLLVLDEEEEA